MQRLPALPQLAREVVTLRAGGCVDYDELAAVASFDGEMARALVRAAGAPTVRDAVFALGPAGLMRTVLPFTLRAMFPEGGDGSLDRAAFWAHAVAAADLAEALAAHMGLSSGTTAYGAGLLCNIGRLVLATIVPEDYAGLPEGHGPDGAALVEAERRALGVDHTLAGKWLAENWGLPDEYIAAIWLHHHPPGALDGTHYPVALVEAVMLASEIAQARLAGAVETDIVALVPDVLLRRTGLTRETLLDLLAAPSREERSGPAPRGEFIAAADTDRVRRLERRLMRLDALERLHLDLAQAHGVGAILEKTACTVREAFAAPWGFCCAADIELACVEARWWPEPHSRIENAALPLPGAEDGAPDAPHELSAEQLQGVLDGTTLTELLRRPGFVMIPMSAGGRTAGQVLLDTTDAPGRFTEEDLSDLRWFARAAGLAVARLRAGQEVCQRNEEMAEALTAREAEFRRKLRTERLAGIAKLAAGAAHEINNPLAVISGRAQMMLNRNLSQEDAKGLETIIEQSRRASKILTDMMQFARPPEPKLDPTVLPFLLRQVLVTLRPRFARQKIRIVDQFADGLPRVCVDRRRIEHAFLNVFINAEQAMAKKGGTLTVRAYATADRRQVCIEIADTGPGIAPEHFDQIFEPFFTTRGQGEGTGLGLSVSHGIIESHGGTIEAGGQSGQGAVFRITLPAASETVPFVKPAAAPPTLKPELSLMHGPSVPPSPEPEAYTEETAADGDAAQAVRPPREAVPPREHGARGAEPPAILIVDSDADLREILKETFQCRGCRALAASDSVEATALMTGYRVDLVILDISMPRRDGLTLLRELRERERELPVVVLTGMATEEEIREALDLGVRACLQKPFELKRLLAEIDDALASRSAA